MKFASIGVVGLVAMAAFVMAAATPAEATKPVDGEHKAVICHATNAVTNPYVMIEVDYAAIDDQGGQSDHMHHTGPVSTSEADAQDIKDSGNGKDGHWGDIIPPVDGVTAGLNWTEEGQAIYDNDCQYTEDKGEVVDVKDEEATETDNNGSGSDNSNCDDTTNETVEDTPKEDTSNDDATDEGEGIVLGETDDSTTDNPKAADTEDAGTGAAEELPAELPTTGASSSFVLAALLAATTGFVTFLAQSLRSVTNRKF